MVISLDFIVTICYNKNVTDCYEERKIKMKKLFALLFLLVITTFSILVSCSNEYEWPNTEIANLLPRPESSKGEVHSDSEDYFRITVEKTTKNHINECNYR